MKYLPARYEMRYLRNEVCAACASAFLQARRRADGATGYRLALGIMRTAGFSPVALINVTRGFV